MDDTQSGDDKKHQSVRTPQIHDEESSMGSTPDPESDDNALDNAQEMGLYPNANEENPEELNIAKQVEEAEIEHQG